MRAEAKRELERDISLVKAPEGIRQQSTKDKEVVMVDVPEVAKQDEMEN